MPSTIEIAIVGGGLGGLTLAIGLSKYSHLKIQVYEAASKFSEIGAGMILGPNTLQAMKLIDPRIIEAYEKVCVYEDTKPDSNGDYSWVNLWQGYGEGAGEHCVSLKNRLRPSTVHRAELLGELVKLVDPKICHFSKRLERIEDDPLTIYFHDGTTATADIIIGADGIHSPTRQHILGHEHPAARAVYTGHATFRALIPVETAYQKLGSIVDNYFVFMGPNHIIVAYKIAGGTQLNMSIVDFSYGDWENESWVIPGDPASYKKKFEDWHKTAKAVLELLPADKTAVYSIWDMPPAPTYFRGRVAIAGDAAHASTPFQSAGVGQAFEDALVLERVLGNIQSQSQIGSALQAYDTVRRFRSQRVVLTSEEHGAVMAHQHPRSKGDPQNIKEVAENMLNWIWEYDQQQQVDDALMFMRNIKGE